MAEISVQFSNQLNGYKKSEVDQFVKDAEEKLQEKALALALAQQQVVELEARLNGLTEGDVTVEEKVELYDKLMKKMDGDYENLLAPAIAKAKAIEDKASEEYAVRIDQARYSAEGIYEAAAGRIAGVVDDNMDRLYQLLDRYIYSKTLLGRMEAFAKECRAVSAKVAQGVVKASKATGTACGKACGKVKTACTDAKKKVTDKIRTYKKTITAKRQFKI
ncbi:MAG: hypothetical protein IKJ35_05395 [Clostridia bacterium]|nr:hypothetical protein [Clostridia bacterium]